MYCKLGETYKQSNNLTKRTSSWSWSWSCTKSLLPSDPFPLLFIWGVVTGLVTVIGEFYLCLSLQVGEERSGLGELLVGSRVRTGSYRHTLVGSQVGIVIRGRREDTVIIIIMILIIIIIIVIIIIVIIIIIKI